MAWLSGKGSDLKPDELREAVHTEIQRRTVVASVEPLAATDDLLRLDLNAEQDLAIHALDVNRARNTEA